MPSLESPLEALARAALTELPIVNSGSGERAAPPIDEHLEPLGEVQLKGKAKRMPVHILVGDAQLAATPAFIALHDAHFEWLAGRGDLATCIARADDVDSRLLRFYELIPGRADDFASPA